MTDLLKKKKKLLKYPKLIHTNDTNDTLHTSIPFLPNEPTKKPCTVSYTTVSNSSRIRALNASSYFAPHLSNGLESITFWEWQDSIKVKKRVWEPKWRFRLSMSIRCNYMVAYEGSMAEKRSFRNEYQWLKWCGSSNKGANSVSHPIHYNKIIRWLPFSCHLISRWFTQRRTTTTRTTS